MKRRTVIYLDYSFFNKLQSDADNKGLSLSAYINFLLSISAKKIS